jgi:hypothetical protein
MFNVAAIAGVTIALLTQPLVSAPAVAPPSGKVTIEVVTINGSGCPAGTTALAVATDNTAFTVTYSQYLAEDGGGAAVTAARKNCQLGLLVHVPSGFTYAVAQADYRGFAHLERGASAIERANYYFMGDSQNTPVSHTIAGPLNDNWITTDKVEDAALVFAPCGVERNLNVNTELRADAGPSGKSSYIAMDSTDGHVSTIYHFAWKKC